MEIIQHNLFSPTCCNVCLLNPTTNAESNKPSPVTEKLLKCLGCKLILYCSAEHQKLDWPIHKKFCKAVSSILTKNKINHLFQIAGPIRTKKDLSDVTLKIKYKLISLLKRPLEHHEEELTSFPVMCSVCFSTKYSNLYQCKKCNAISYCSLEHEQEDAPIHQNECILLKIYYSKFKIDSGCIFKLEQKQTCKLLESSLPKAMATMFEYEFASDPCEILAEYQEFSFISDFSCVATVSYFLEYLNRFQKLECGELTLFIAGSTVDELWFTPVHVKFFFASFPEIFKLNIVFIGPEIKDNAVMETTTVLDDDDNKRSLFRTSFQGTLENYIQNNTQAKLFKPDLIVCFNCGFSEKPTADGPSDFWVKGIQQFMKLQNIPILFTSYTNLEAHMDLKALEHVIEIENRKENLICLEKIIEKQRNPYRDMRPLRNWEFIDPEKIFFRNGYLQAVRFVPAT